MPTVLRRLLLWTVVCCVSAAPSFVWAHEGFSRPAMVFGVALFVAAYTGFTSTEAFERLHRRPFVRRTLYIGYGTRLVLSLAFPIGMGVDLIPGLMSIRVVELVGMEPRSFAGTLAITIVQGGLLNAIIGVFMLVVYSIQRATMKPPVDAERHGFEVVVGGPPQPVIPLAAADRLRHDSERGAA